MNPWFSTKTPFTLQLGQSMSNAGLEEVLWNKSETQVCSAKSVCLLRSVRGRAVSLLHCSRIASCSPGGKETNPKLAVLWSQALYTATVR